MKVTRSAKNIQGPGW